MYLRARYYSPSVGRFTSRDVWEGDYYQPLSYNAWLYTFADPTNQVDPSGMYPQIDGYNEKVSPAGITWTLAADPLRSGAGGIPYGVNQAQFKINPNSCGPVSAAAIIRSKAPSVTAQEVYEKAKEMTAQVPGFDSPNNLGPGELEKLISQFVLDKYDTQWYAEWGYIDEWITGKPYHWKEPEGAQRAANQLTQWLRASYLIVTGVMANRSSGKILPSYGGTTGHWVVITGISANWEQGEKWDSALNWVRVYNPFDNETEYYPWRDFRDSWNKDGYMLVLVKPTNIPYEHRSCK